MRVRALAGVIALALVAGVAGLVAGSFLTGNGPPPWLTDTLMRSDTGRQLAQWWIDASAPAIPCSRFRGSLSPVGGLQQSTLRLSVAI